MMLNLTDLGETLLRRGIAPKHVRRLLRELEDHQNDLESEVLAAGLDAEEASREAWSRLGSKADLIDEMTARSELLSWSGRWPVLVYALLPPLVLAGVLFATACLVVGAVALAGNTGQLPPVWFAGSIEALMQGVVYTTPLLICAAICWQAFAQRSHWSMPTLGTLIVALLGGAFDLTLHLSDVPGASSLRANLALLAPFPDVAETTFRTLTTLALVLLPYFGMRRRFTQIDA